jgi:hypothetical protein
MNFYKLYAGGKFFDKTTKKGIFILFLLMSATSVAEEKFRTLSSHEHGVAQLNIVYEKNHMNVEFISPSFNIVGFGHKPASKQQKEKVKNAFVLLKKADKLFKFPSSFGAKLESAKVTSDIEEDKDHKHDEHDKDHKHDEHDKDHKHDEHDKEHEESGSHSDFKANYVFSIKNNKKPLSVDVMFFKYFASIENIKVKVITAKKQTSMTLKKGKNKIRF